jgi:hypothetical protein
MKGLLSFSLLLFLFSGQVFANHAPSRGTNPLLRFVAEIRILREVALATLIEERCDHYLPRNERNSCYEAVEQKITLLDFDILLGDDKKTPVLLDKNIPGSFVFVAFKKDFLRLLSDQKTSKYLEVIQSEMTKYLTGQKEAVPNLWEVSLNFYGNEFEAAQAMAVLFQDTSNVKLHLAYLEMSGDRGTTNAFDPNRELLNRTIDMMNFVLDSRIDTFQELFYPRTVQAKLHRTIYHFYVPTYLAMALRRKGVPARYAAIAPFMMSLTYEFITAAPDTRYLFDDPVSVEEWSLGDIYGSFNGVSFSMGRMNSVQTFEDVKAAFAVSTVNGVRSLIH